MAFPSNPTNGQTANVNGVVYTYSSILTAWQVTTTFSGNVTVAQLNADSVVSTGNITGGNLVSTGTATVTGNITGGNLVSTGTATVTGNITGNNSTITTSVAVGATTPSGTSGEIRSTNAITSYYSDQRLKTEICRIENALDKIDTLSGVIYTQNKLAESFGYHDYSLQVGLYAGDVKKVQPEAVKLAPFDIDINGTSKTGENYLTVQYEKLVPLLVEGIKELRRDVKQIKNLIGPEDNHANNS